MVDKAGHDASGHDANDHMVATARQTRLAAARLETAVRQLAAHAPDAPEFRVAARMLSETLDLHSSLVDWCHGERTVGRDLRARSAQWSGRSGEIDQLLAHAHQLVVSA